MYLGDAIYLLAKSPLIPDYTLCEMRSWVTPYCSTHFNISGTAGSHMRAHCEDPDDADSYIKSVPDVTEERPDGDWRVRSPQSEQYPSCSHITACRGPVADFDGHQRRHG